MDFTEAWEDTCSGVGFAARHGDVDSIKKLINEGASVDVGDNRGWKPLHEAAAASTGVQCLEILLDNPKTNVNWITYEGETALLLACKRRKRNVKEAVALLLRHGAQPNFSDNDLETPLLVATKKGELSVVRLLVSANADVNVADCSGWTPLHEAAKSDVKIDILKKLLASNAKLDTEDECGCTPVFVAAQHGQKECLRTLLKIAKHQGLHDIVNCGAEDHATPLMIAAQQNFGDCMKILLAYGANPNIYTRDGASALHSATQGNFPKCLQLLLNKMEIGPLIEHCHPKGFKVEHSQEKVSPIHLAIDWKSYDCLHLLLNAGFSPDSVKLSDYFATYPPIFSRYMRVDSALAYAVSNKDRTSVSMLLDAGASPNVPSREAIHPLSEAIGAQDFKMFDFLLDKGSDANYCVEHLNNILVAAFINPQWRKFLPMVLRAGSNPRQCFMNSENIRIYLDPILRLTTVNAFAWKMMWLLQFVTIDSFIQSAFNTIETKARAVERILPETWKDIHTALSQPSSLKHICRMTIRLAMYERHGSRFRRLIHSLPIPSGLIKYLSFKPIFDGKYLNPPAYVFSHFDDDSEEDVEVNS